MTKAGSPSFRLSPGLPQHGLGRGPRLILSSACGQVIQVMELGWLCRIDGNQAERALVVQSWRALKAEQFGPAAER